MTRDNKFYRPEVSPERGDKFHQLKNEVFALMREVEDRDTDLGSERQALRNVMDYEARGDYDEACNEVRRHLMTRRVERLDGRKAEELRTKIMEIRDLMCPRDRKSSDQADIRSVVKNSLNSARKIDRR